MDLIYKLPYELVTNTYEYDPEQRKKMKWVLEDIRNSPYCEVCNKIIIKYIWSLRNCDMICCSSKCLKYYY